MTIVMYGKQPPFLGGSGFAKTGHILLNLYLYLLIIISPSSFNCLRCIFFNSELETSHPLSLESVYTPIFPFLNSILKCLYKRSSIIIKDNRPECTLDKLLQTSSPQTFAELMYDVPSYERRKSNISVNNPIKPVLCRNHLSGFIFFHLLYSAFAASYFRSADLT